MHGHLEARHLYDGDPGETWEDDASVRQSVSTVNNFGDAFLALLQISVDNNWQDILWANTIEAKRASYFNRGAIGVYFCSFFVVMGWFGLNILTALVIETYDIAKGKLEDARKSEVATRLVGYQSRRPGDEDDGAVVTLASGSSAECLRCGPGGCAVFVPTKYDAATCQCGHAALYHRPTDPDFRRRCGA